MSSTTTKNPAPIEKRLFELATPAIGKPYIWDRRKHAATYLPHKIKQGQGYAALCAVSYAATIDEALAIAKGYAVA